MSVSKLAYRYAKSVIDLAIEKGQLEEVMSDMRLLNTASDQVREFYLMLKSPIVNGDKKMVVTKSLFSGRMNPISEGFLNILMRKNRESYLPEIIDACLHLYNKHKSITPVKITSAVSLSDDALQGIVNKLKATAQLQNVELQTAIDDTLIGGYILQWDDMLIDNSIQRSLSVLKDEFDNNDYVRKF